MLLVGPNLFKIFSSRLALAPKNYLNAENFILSLFYSEPFNLLIVIFNHFIAFQMDFLL